MSRLYNVAIPEDTNVVFAISDISFFILKHTKKSIEEQELIASEKFDNALAEFMQREEK